MGKTEKLNDLFDEWRKSAINAGRFVSDGIIDEAEWGNSSVKALYIFDDINIDADNPNRSLVEQLNLLARSEVWDDLYSSTLANIIRWTHGINLGYMRYHRTMENFRDIRISLSKCAILNLNKFTGTTRTDKTDIGKRIAKDRSRIRDEISIVDPDVIICCGTFGIVKHDLFEDNADACCLNTGGTCLVCECEEGGRHAFFDHYHPNNRMVQTGELYNTLAYNLLSAHAQGIVSLAPFTKLSREMLYYMINSHELA
jgi:hypothetical protein